MDQDKIDRAKKIFKAKTETKAMDRSLGKVIQEDREKLRRKKVMKRIVDLRNDIGKIHEDSTEWVRVARQERTLSYDSGA